MAQKNTTIPNKSTGDQFLATELVDLNDTVNDNANDAESRLATAETKLAGIEDGAQVNDPNALTTADIGNSVQAQSAILDGTTASFTTEDKNKLDTISGGGGSTTEEIVADLDVGGISALDVFPIGTTLQELAESLLTTVYYPTFVSPSAFLSGGNANVESGTVITSLAAAFDAGDILGDLNGGIWDPNLKQDDRSGPATTYSFSGDNLSPVSGPASSISISVTAVDGSNSFTVQTFYDSGPQPLDSKGNNFDAPLPSGLVSDSFVVNGRRNAFYGVDLAGQDSASVRALSNSLLNPSNGSTFTINIPTGATSVSFAYPATLQDVSAVIHVEGLNSDIKSVFGAPQTVQVEGANGYSSIAYKVYTFTPPSPYSAEATYIVTI